MKTGKAGTRIALVMTGLLVVGQGAAQTVRWEDYRGNQNVAPNSQYTGPAGAPTFVNYPNSGAIAALRAVSANSANAVRTGTSATIDFASGDVNSLCDNRNNTTSAPCRLQAQGKVAYALVQFPQAGTYTIAAAHDDNVVIELSPDFTNTNYRTASYSILAGSVTDWSSSETDFQTFGTFTAANANSCALLRMYWNNQAGLNYNHLQWTTPGGTTQIVPASAFRDPAAVSSSTGCNGSITGNLASITLNKVLGSPRINANDQYTVEISTTTTSAGGTQQSATTSGSGTGQQASTGAFATVTGTTYYVRERMAPGSTSGLSAYTKAIACTKNGAAYTPVGNGGNANVQWWSLGGAGAADQFVCTITNTAPAVKPTVTVNKVSLGGTGIFTFSGSNGVSSQTITTSGDSVPTAGATDTLTASSTQTTITEGAPPAGWILQGINCTGLGTGGTQAANIATRTITLDASATTNGSAIICTFTNRKITVDLAITKSNGAGVTSVIAGTATTYTIRVANSGPDTATGAILSDPAAAHLTKTAVACSATPGLCTAGTTPTIAQLESGYALPAIASGQFYEITVTCTVN